MKTYLHHAALKQEMTKEARITALADGAHNCWSVLSALEPQCKFLKRVLNWFHVGKKFQNVSNGLGQAFTKSLESAKWSLWHGQVDDTLRKIALLRDNITEEKKQTKLQSLQDYLNINSEYLVNYDKRAKGGLVYTSQIVETHIDIVINARYKKKQKMQWTREEAHNVSIPFG